MRLTEDEYNALISRRTDWAGRSPDSGVGQATGRPRRDQEKQAIRQSRKQPNKTERRFELEKLLPWQHSGEIVGYQFEAITLRLANGLTYKPDYLTYGPKGTRIYEVKGEYIYEDAKIKLKVAPSQFHFWEFYLAQWIKGEWFINKVLP